MSLRGLIDAVGRHRRASWATAAILAGSVWFLWPSLSSSPGNVASVGDARFQAATRQLTSEVRDKGRNLVNLAEADDWCALDAALAATSLPPHTDYVVIGIAEHGTCAGDPVAAAFGRLRRQGAAPVLLVYPGEQPAATGVRTVLTESLLGAPDDTVQTCQWWDTCDPSGTVAVRADDGTLTDAGLNRIARMVAAVIG